MDDMMTIMGEFLPVEVFSNGQGDAFMSVPRLCGLDQADRLVLGLDGRGIPMRGDSILPIDFPKLSEQITDELVSLGSITVAEFSTAGVTNLYTLRVVDAY